MSHLRRLLACCLLLGSVVSSSAAEPLADDEVPEALRSWLPWVLHDRTPRACSHLANGTLQRCAWAGPLTLELGADGGRFAVSVVTQAPSWVVLPGASGQWPQDVTRDGVLLAVTARDGYPAVELPAGTHQLSGRYVWPTLPDALHVPPDFGLVSLSLAGVAASQRVPGADGQLWLKARDAATAESDRLDVQVFRQLVDEQPMQVVTALEIDVAGASREVTLTGALLADSVPMQLDSPLPARLEEDGRLRLQVRPGHWSLRLTSRQQNAVLRLELPVASAPWPQEEVWVFAARTALRLVEVGGVTPVDPRQTTLPADWQGLPAWRLAAGDALDFTLKRRGDPEPEPDQLALSRELWLDFDGGGYTLKDQLSGRITRQWRLEATPALVLGRVLLNGEAQFITSAADGNGRRGVEVRRGALELSADSRYEGQVTQFPAVGWAHDVNSLQATLHLPPGWRLWSARGVDNVPETWLKRWTLLDLFLVLMATVATSRLLGWRAALLMLFTLTLLWHEAQAPRQIWLHLLAAIALARVLPAGRVRAAVDAYRGATLVVLAVIAIGFMIEQVRVGLYPQLAQPWTVLGQGARDVPAPVAASAPPVDAMMGGVAEGMVGAPPEPAMVANEAMSATDSAYAEMPQRMRKTLGTALGASLLSRYDIDPKAQIQTGPGLPDWQWTSVTLGWNGPVTQDQQVDLVLLPPLVNLVLAFVRVILLGVLLVLFVRASAGHQAGWLNRLRGAVPAVLCVFLGGAVLLMPRESLAALPDAALLQELEQRLLRAPECLPQCAEIPRLHVRLDAASLTLQFEVHLALALAVPLPGHREHWTPAVVEVDDGAQPVATWRDGGGVLWLALTPGVHRITLRGGVPEGASFQLPFALPPRLVELALAGWTASGVRPDGSSEPELIFSRRAAVTGGTTGTLEPRALPAFFRVERHLRLGLDWRVTTVVTRLTPADSAAALAIPLLPGESVTTAEVRVEDAQVLVNMAAGQGAFQWESVLEKAHPLVLTAAASSDWMEVWRADISPLWHAALSGLAVVHHQDESGSWLPTWQPWPGETVTLALFRPAGVDGQSLTIDHSALRVQPAARTSAVTLDFRLRSSQGGQHVITLPADATLQTIAIDGVTQPIRPEGRQLTLPLIPGEQQVQLSWHAAAGMTARYHTPAFSLGTPSVNASIEVELPQDRWVLLAGGPRLGPAVLFWGVLLVLFAFAVALGRTRLTPLGTGQWLLLAVGLSQIDVVQALVVVGWLFALAWRERAATSLGRRSFNLLQVLLALLTLVALALLFAAIRQGLLGQPDMQIAGNGSSAGLLRWYQDRIGIEHPQAWVISVSLWFYRGLMLLWALWLAFALLDWLRWSWRCFSSHALWQAAPPKMAPADDAADSPTPPA